MKTKLLLVAVLALIGVDVWFHWGRFASEPMAGDPSSAASPAPAEALAPTSVTATPATQSAAVAVNAPPVQVSVPSVPVAEPTIPVATPPIAAAPTAQTSPPAVDTRVPAPGVKRLAPAEVPAPGVKRLAPAELAKVVAESKRMAIARYPALAATNSEHNVRFVAQYRKMAAENNPQLHEPDWPMRLAEECAPTTAAALSTLANTLTAAHAESTPAVAPKSDAVPLISLNVSPMNAGATYDVHWLTYYDGYDISGHANKALDLNARNLSPHGTQVTVQWIFTARRGSGGSRYIFDMGSKDWDLEPNQSTHLGVRSRDLAGRTIWYAYSGYTYRYGSEIDGWIVVVRHKDKALKTVGSSSTLETLVNTPDFASMVAAYQGNSTGGVPTRSTGSVTQ